jgi:hypothetical protein
VGNPLHIQSAEEVDEATAAFVEDLRGALLAIISWREDGYYGVARAKRLLVPILHLCFSVLQSDASGKADKPILRASAPASAPNPVGLFVSTKQPDLLLEKATLNQCIQCTGV